MLKGLLQKLRSAPPPSLYLGEVSVVPKGKFGSVLEELLKNPFEPDLDKELQGHLYNWLDIPHITHAQKRDNALVLDVYVCSYRQGQSLSGQILDVPLFAFWRPKIELRSRLSWAQSKKVVSTYTVQKKMPWGQYWNKLFSLRYFLFGRNIANSKDMEALLGTAVLDLLGQVRRSV